MDPGADSDPDPVFFVIFKDKKSKRSHKTVEIKIFLYYFCLMIEGSGSGSIPLTNGSDPDPGGIKTYGSDGSELGSGSPTLSGEYSAGAHPPMI
jgi:hypothetical protein